MSNRGGGVQGKPNCCIPKSSSFAEQGWHSGVVGALASHQCAPGSIPGPGVICGLTLLLVL